MTPARRSLSWNDRRNRSVVYQLLTVLAVAAVAAAVVDNAVENLTRLRIASGFDFLDVVAGFDIATSLIAYDPTETYGRAFLVGLVNTLLVAALGIVFATVLGFAIGIARLSRNWLVARLAAVYVETLRNVPLLLQLFFWYFAVLRALPSPRGSLEWFEAIFLNNRGLYLPGPEMGEAEGWLVFLAAAIGVAGVACALAARRRPRLRTVGLAGAALSALVVVAALLAAPWEQPALRGFNFQGGIVVTPELAALLLALSIYTGAFIAEVVRAGIQAVPRGQVEAARALGLTEGQTRRFVVIPLALRVIIPPLANQYLNLTKNSSLAAAIAYPDLVSVFAGTVLNQTGQAVEVIAITMAVYLAISLAIAGAMNLYNRYVTRTGYA